MSPHVLVSRSCSDFQSADAEPQHAGRAVRQRRRLHRPFQVHVQLDFGQSGQRAVRNSSNEISAVTAGSSNGQFEPHGLLSLFRRLSI